MEINTSICTRKKKNSLMEDKSKEMVQGEYTPKGTFCKAVSFGKFLIILSATRKCFFMFLILYFM